jgi:hypothetical protein
MKNGWVGELKYDVLDNIVRTFVNATITPTQQNNINKYFPIKIWKIDTWLFSHRTFN